MPILPYADPGLRTIAGRRGPEGPRGDIGPRGPAGYNATGAAEDQDAIAGYIKAEAGPNPVSSELDARIAAPSMGVKVPTLGVGNGTADLARNPAYFNVVINGSTLGSAAADGTDMVGHLNDVTFLGGFTNEASKGVSNPGFAWGANDYVITGTAAGDVAGLSNLWARLSEAHIRAPGAALSQVFGLAGQTNVEATATSGSINLMASGYFTGPKNRSPSGAVAVGTAAALFVLNNGDNGDGTTPGVTDNYSIYQGGSAPNKFNGPSSFVGGITVGGAAGLVVNNGAFQVDASGNTKTDGYLFAHGLYAQSQTAAAGVYVGNGAGTYGLTIASGTDAWTVDSSSGVLRFLKTGSADVAHLDFSGNLTLRDGGSIGTIAQGTGLKIGAAATQKLGFWGKAPVVQQVLATGASHTVDDVITALQNLGLFKQS